jgi:Glycosyltransferase family 10 (fucosyltransferase) C-term/Fucosyltransferase, N-terminal
VSKDHNVPLVVFATKVFGQPVNIDDIRRIAGGTNVLWSRDHRLVPLADVVIIHIPSYPVQQPIRKFPGQVWVALCVESAQHYPQLDDPSFIETFDLTMTYRRGSDIWAPYLPTLASWAGIARTPAAVASESATAALFVSSGYDKSGRQTLLAELFRYMRIDSYGTVFHNCDLVDPDLGRASKIDTLTRYPLAFAFENAIDEDYVTEKIFDCLRAGSIPVYLGAPNVAAFVPDGSYINAAAYGSARNLAAYLQSLAQHPEAGARYHSWRTKPLPPPLRMLCASIEREAFVRLAERCCEMLGDAPRRRHRSAAALAMEGLARRIGPLVRRLHH